MNMTSTYPPRTILDENGNQSGYILSPDDFQTYLKLLNQYVDWETLPSYLQDAIDNMLADDAEREAGDLMSLADFIASET